MVSVVVPTYNRVECLLNMLKSMHKQKNVEFEVLVIDQSEFINREKITAILNSCKNVQYFHINKRGRCLSKNFGIDKAKGDIILFCDDDIIIEENFLAEHVNIHSRYPEVGGLSCHLIEPHENEISSNNPLKITFYGRFINRPNTNYNGFVTSLNGGNMSFKREAMDSIGFFDENLSGTSMLEEPDMAIRLMKNNYKIYFSSGTKVKHFPQHNGNIKIKNAKSYDWLKGYYFNQYFFVFRNKRNHYLVFVFTYLYYRIFIEMYNTKSFSMKYLFLPLLTFISAYKSWRKENHKYQRPWFTPKFSQVEILKFESN